MHDDSQDTGELVELLTEGELWAPRGADELYLAVEGPGVLPYLPVFRSRRAAAELFPEHGVHLAPGKDLLAHAVSSGWGVVHGVRVGISWGAALGIWVHMQGEELREFPRLRDIAGMQIAAAPPIPGRVREGCVQALRHVLEADLTVERAWLLALTPYGLPERMAVLVVVAEAIEDMRIDAEDLTQRLLWASPPGDAIEAFELGSQEGLLAQAGIDERVSIWPPVYPETSLH